MQTLRRSVYKNRKGIFEYVLGGLVDTKLLEVRVFDEVTKKRFIQHKPLKQIKMANQIVRFVLLDTTLIKVKFGVLMKWTLTMFRLGARVVKAILKTAKCCVKPTIGQKAIGKQDNRTKSIR